jgi:hypothetical protein
MANVEVKAPIGPKALPLGRTRENAIQLCLYEHLDEFQD